MPTVLLEHDGEMLTDEFGSRNPAFARCTREQSVLLPSQGNGDRFHFAGEYHEVGMTRSVSTVKVDSGRAGLLAQCSAIRSSAGIVSCANRRDYINAIAVLSALNTDFLN